MKEMKERDASWLRQLDNRWLGCRSMRHAWNLNRFEIGERDEIRGYLPPGAQVLKRTLDCTRCQTVRVDFYIRMEKQALNGFRRKGSRYLYPKGYTFVSKEHALARPEPSDYVLESFRRNMTTGGNR